MAWESAEWACGHKGSIQLLGPGARRKSRLAYEAGRKCMACWLLDQWTQQGDPRAARPDARTLAIAVAGGKGIRIAAEAKSPVPAGWSEVEA